MVARVFALDWGDGVVGVLAALCGVMVAVVAEGDGVDLLRVEVLVGGGGWF